MAWSFSLKKGEREKELEELEHMERIPLLYHEVLVYFQKFMMENRELVETSMSRE